MTNQTETLHRNAQGHLVPESLIKTIDLLREIPEALKPQKIAIGTDAPTTPVIDVQPEASDADKAAA